MANDMYALGRQNWLAGNVDWDADSINDTLIDAAADYTRNLATHDDYATDVGAAAKVSAGDSALGSKTNTTGTLDAADSTHSTVSGDPTEEIILWVDTGGTDYLLINWDTGVSATPNGGTITVQWNGTAIMAWS